MSFFDPIIPLLPQFTSNIAPQLLPTIYSGSNHSIKPNISYQNQIYQSNEYDHPVNSNFQKQNNNVGNTNNIPNSANMATKSTNLPTPKQEQNIPYCIPDNSKVINQVLQFSFNNSTNNANMPYFSPLNECTVNNIAQTAHLPINNANNSNIPYYSPIPNYSAKQKKSIHQNFGMAPTPPPSNNSPIIANNSTTNPTTANINMSTNATLKNKTNATTTSSSTLNNSYTHYYSLFDTTKGTNQVFNHALNNQNVVLPPVPPTSTTPFSTNFLNTNNNTNTNTTSSNFNTNNNSNNVTPLNFTTNSFSTNYNNHFVSSTHSTNNSNNNNSSSNGGVLDSIDSILQRQTQYTCFPYRNNFEYLSPSIFDTSNTSKKSNNSIFYENKNSMTSSIKPNILLNTNVDEVIAGIVNGRSSKSFPVAIGSEMKNQKKMTKQSNKSTPPTTTNSNKILIGNLKNKNESEVTYLNELNTLVLKNSSSSSTSINNQNKNDSKIKLKNSISSTLSKSILNAATISNSLSHSIINENVNTKQHGFNTIKINDESNEYTRINVLKTNPKQQQQTQQINDNVLSNKNDDEILSKNQKFENLNTTTANTSSPFSPITITNEKEKVTVSISMKPTTTSEPISEPTITPMSVSVTTSTTIPTSIPNLKNENKNKSSSPSGINKKNNYTKTLECDNNSMKNGKSKKNYQQSINEKSKDTLLSKSNQTLNTKNDTINSNEEQKLKESLSRSTKGSNLIGNTVKSSLQNSNSPTKSPSMKIKENTQQQQQQQRNTGKQNPNKSNQTENFKVKTNISLKAENRNTKNNTCFKQEINGLNMNTSNKSEAHHTHGNNTTNTNNNSNSISHIHCSMRKALTERNDRVAWQSYKEIAENKNLKDLSHTDFSRILRILRNERGPVRSPNNLNEMVQIIENIKEAGFQPNHGDFTTMIAAFGRSHQLVKALTYFEEMKQANLEPDIFTYNTLIDVYGKNKELHSAVKIFNEMKEKKLKPTLATYNILISAHGLNEDPKGAKYWFDCVMNDPTISANEITYSNIMDAYARVGDVQCTLKYLNEMKSQKINPSLGHYNSLVLVYTKVGDIEKATEKLNEMKEKGMEPSPHIYSLLMNAYGENNNITGAFKILNNHHKKPGRSMYHTMIQLYGKKGDLLNAWQTLSQMIQQRITPTPLTWRILASCHGDKPGIMFWSQQVNIIPTAAMYNHFLEYYSKQPNIKAVTQLFDEMITQHFSPTIETYNSILHAHSILGDSDAVFKVYSELKNAKLEPNLYTYNILLKVYAKVGDNQSAMALFEKEIIPREPYGVIPDAFTYNALLESYNEKFDQSAFKYLDDMKAKGLAPVPHRDTAILKAIHALQKSK